MRGEALVLLRDAINSQLDPVLGYLDPGFFAGGRILLNFAKAAEAIQEAIGNPLGYDLYEAAAGCTES